MKKIVPIILIVFLQIMTTGCQEKPAPSEYTKYSDSFFNAFDTIIRVVAYTKSEEEFNAYFEKIEERFIELHRLYDKYNDYEGINNIKTINDNAGIKPVKVEREIIDLILFSKEWYIKTNGKINIAMGPVLEIWHDYREEGNYDPSKAKIPPMDELKEASKYTNIDKIIVDTEASTVYLADKGMKLDVGAVAKGFAAEIVAQEVMAAGLESGIINAGGNIRVLGKPLDGIRERWGIGIHNPDKIVVTDGDNHLDIVFVNNASVVTSGDYQRYYIVDGEVMHHLIDPDTLMPGKHYRAVTVVTEDAGLADILSTAVFLMPYDESRQFVEGIEGVEALWVMYDGSVETTNGMKEIMKSYGATGAK